MRASLNALTSTGSGEEAWAMGELGKETSSSMRERIKDSVSLRAWIWWAWWRAMARWRGSWAGLRCLKMVFGLVVVVVVVMRAEFVFGEDGDSLVRAACIEGREDFMVDDPRGARLLAIFAVFSNFRTRCNSRASFSLFPFPF